MRQLHEVLTALYEVIPQEEHQLIADLKKIEMSNAFAAPETAGMWWRETAYILHDRIGHADDLSKLEDWQQKVVKIFIGEKINGN